MKAIILSAGQGRRLMPLTANTPKCCLMLAGKTLLEHQVESLVVGNRLRGISRYCERDERNEYGQ